MSASTTMRLANHALAGLFLLIALGGAALPWVQGTGVSLAANSYDLAEWLSLHPTVRATSQILLPALLLRFTLVALGWLCVVQAMRGGWWFAVPALALWIGFVPPVAFLRGAFNDPNYLQQFILWLVYTVGVIRLVWFPVVRWRAISVVIALVGIGCAISGVYIAHDLINRYEIGLSFGLGWIFYAVGLGFLLGVNVWGDKAGSENHLPHNKSV